MQTFTIMRKVVVENSEPEDDTWIVWEVWESSPEQAVERVADIPGVYYVYRDDALTFQVEEVKNLKVIGEPDVD